MCRKPDRPRPSRRRTATVIGASAFISPSASAASAAGVIVFGLRRHDLRDRARQQPVVHVPAQIAVGDDADEPTAAVAHADAAEALARSSRGSLRDIGASGDDQRHLVARVHDARTRSSRRPSLPPGWNSWKSAGGEALALEQRDRQRVAERHHHRRRGRRRQAHRAGLGARAAAAARTSAASARRARRRAGDRDQRDLEAPRIGDDVAQLGASRRNWTRRGPRPRRVIMPRSPWLASAGWTNSAGVPVEASVAAILRATWPLLPMPVTTTRPLTAAEQLDARLEAADPGAPAPSSACASARARGAPPQRAAWPARAAWCASVALGLRRGHLGSSAASGRAATGHGCVLADQGYRARHGPRGSPSTVCRPAVPAAS